MCIRCFFFLATDRDRHYRHHYHHVAFMDDQWKLRDVVILLKLQRHSCKFMLECAGLWLFWWSSSSYVNILEVVWSRLLQQILGCVCVMIFGWLFRLCPCNDQISWWQVMPENHKHCWCLLDIPRNKNHSDYQQLTTLGLDHHEDDSKACEQTSTG